MLRPRLHKSSIIVAIGVALVIALIAVPGRVDEWSPAAYATFEHGWPFVYLRRRTVQSRFPKTFFSSRREAQSSLPLWGIPWLGRPNWQVWQADHWQFSAQMLILDGLVIAIVLAAIIACHEFRRRRRSSTLSFSLVDVFVVVTAICIALGWIAHLKRDAERERAIAARLDGVNSPFVDDVACIAPVWMKSLAGERWMPDFTWRVETVWVHLLERKDARHLCDEIRELPYLKKLVLQGSFGGDSHFPFSTLASISQLETLELEGPPRLDARDIRELAELDGLTKIAVSPISLVNPDLLQQLQSSLPNCNIVDLDKDW